MPRKQPPQPPPTQTGSLTHSPFAKLKQAPDFARVMAPPQPPKVLPRVRPRVRLELAGRGGKVVTRISGLPEANLQAIAGRLQKALGTHASVEESDVVLQGSLDQRALEWLERAGDLRAIVAETSPGPARTASAAAHHEASALPDAGRSGTVRSQVHAGQHVGIVLKADQGTEQITRGVVKELLTNSSHHPRGIKVRLESGEVGRVKIIYTNQG